MEVEYDGIGRRKCGHLFDDFGSCPGLTRAGASTNKRMALEKLVTVEIGNRVLIQSIFTEGQGISIG